MGLTLRPAACTLGAALLFHCLNLVIFLFQRNCDNRSEMSLLHMNSLKNIFSFFMPVDGFFNFFNQGLELRDGER